MTACAKSANYTQWYTQPKCTLSDVPHLNDSCIAGTKHVTLSGYHELHGGINTVEESNGTTGVVLCTPMWINIPQLAVRFLWQRLPCCTPCAAALSALSTVDPLWSKWHPGLIIHPGSCDHVAEGHINVYPSCGARGKRTQFVTIVWSRSGTLLWESFSYRFSSCNVPFMTLRHAYKLKLSIHWRGIMLSHAWSFYSHVLQKGTIDKMHSSDMLMLIYGDSHYAKHRSALGSAAKCSSEQRLPPSKICSGLVIAVKKV